MDREITPPLPKRRKTSIHDESPILVKLQSEGDECPNPDNQTIRIYSWNVNGIAPFLQHSLNSFFTSPSKRAVSQVEAPASLRGFLRRHNWPQVLCLQEIKVGRDDIQTLRSIKQAVNVRSKLSDEPGYELFTTLPQDKFNARGIGGKGRVYGVASIIRSDFYKNYVTAVRTVDWDAEGRFSIIEILSPFTKVKLCIWNVYAVNGTSNEYRSSRTGEVVGTRHDRKLAVHRMMMEECIALEKNGWDIVIIGDLNVASARIDGHPNLRTFPEQHVLNRADFNRRFLDPKNADGLRAVDVWRALRGDERKYTWYSRNGIFGNSCDRVDLALASRRLVEKGAIVGCEIWNTQFERGPSDHVPFSIDVHLAADAVQEDSPENLNVADEKRKIVGI